MTQDFWFHPLRRHHRLSEQLQPRVRPLLSAFSLEHFSYFSISDKGDSVCLSTDPEWMEIYLQKELFLHNPFLKNPALLSSGTFFASGIADRRFQQSRAVGTSYGITDTLIITRKSKNLLRGFSFAIGPNDQNRNLFLNELSLFQRFCTYIEKEAAKTIEALQREPVDVRGFLGERFELTSSSLVPHDHTLRKKLLQACFKGIDLPKESLSSREKECLLLYLEGESTQSISCKLFRSIRTVESHFESAKRKLACSNRHELLKRAKLLFDLGYFQ